MLKIRHEQLVAIEEEQRRRFALEMVEHLREYAPAHALRLGDAALYEFARNGITQAARGAFTLRGPVRLFIELQVLLGSDFDSDPQYPWVAQWLTPRSAADEMMRSTVLHEKAEAFYAAVIGAELQHEKAAIRRLRQGVFEGLPEDDGELEREVLTRPGQLYPEKVSFVGEAPLRALFTHALLACRQLGLTSAAGRATLFSLMFALGHRCHVDPQFAWISQTLEQARRQAEVERVARLRLEFLDFMRTGKTRRTI